MNTEGAFNSGEKKAKRYKLPRWLKLAMGDYGNTRLAHVLNGKLYATDGHVLVVFSGYEGMPDGAISKQAVGFITRRLLEFTATDKQVRLEGECQNEAVEFERPVMTAPSFEKVCQRAEQTGPCVRITITPEILLNAIRASRLETASSMKGIHLDIPVEYLKTGVCDAPWNVKHSHSQAEQILFMPCRLEQEDVERNKAALRQDKSEDRKEGTE